MIKHYLGVLERHYPEILADGSLTEDSGQNNHVVILGDTWVFRFPKHQKALEQMKVEYTVLNTLAGFVSLPIPEPVYSQLAAPVGDAFMGYRMVNGIPLLRSDFLRISSRRTLANSLGTFLAEMHQVPLHHFQKTTLSPCGGAPWWVELHQRFEQLLFPHMSQSAREKVLKNCQAFLDGFPDCQPAPALVHGDFGPSNILYDKSTGAISGIIDFGSVGIGDPAIDLAALIGPFGYGEEFLSLMCTVYPSVTELIPRARYYASTFGLQEALSGIEHDDVDAFQRGIAPYQQ